MAAHATLPLKFYSATFMSLQSLQSKESKSMSLTKCRQRLAGALMAALVLGSGAIALSQTGGFVGTDEPPTGKIVPISPGDSTITLGDAVDDGAQVNVPPQPELPKHWIGILLGAVPDAVRAQVNLPENEGVLVRQVAPEGPAAKAGIEEFDIILKANDKPVTDGTDLMSLVQQEGDSGGKVSLDVLRRGEHQSVALVPEVRPEPTNRNATGTVPGPGWGTSGATRGMPGMQRFGPSGMPLQFRAFGPGTAFSRPGSSLQQMPNGVSVSIQKQNNEPAHIKVQRGNDSWDIVGDDPKSLAQLPDDLRPFVEQLLSESGSTATQMPLMPSVPGRLGPSMRGFTDDEMQRRLQQMEQQLLQMQQRFERDAAQLDSTSLQAEQPIDGSAEAPAE